MITLRTLNAADFADYMDFIDLVFSQAHRPHDFRRLLPKLYRETDAAMACHTAVFEDGRIRASAGLYPMTLAVGDTRLPVAGIGAVSTHARAEGKGYMRRVMESLIARAEAEGYALLFLGGERLRYNRYGFESAGRQYRLTFTDKRLAAFAQDAPTTEFTPWDGTDNAPIPLMQAVNRARRVHLERADADLYDILRSWNCWVDLAREGDALAGFIAYHPENGSIIEAGAVSERALLGLLIAHSRRYGEFAWDLPELPETTAPSLLRWADDLELRECELWRVLDAPRVLEALLALDPPEDGRIVLAVEGQGTLVLEAEAGKVHVRRDEAAQADLTLDALSFTRVVLGQLPPQALLGQTDAARKLAAWFPRPIGICRADEV